MTFANAPRLIKGGLVAVDPTTGAILRSISLQYNPDSLTRTLQVKGAGEGGDRSDALRLTGPAVETIKLEAEIDATDELEFPARNATTVEVGLHPRLAALETLVHPSSGALVANELLSIIGTIEIVPMEAPLTLFVWSASRILPVRITELSVVEEAFDPALNPIRARISLGMRVLSVDDLGFNHPGGSTFVAALKAKERLARRAPPASLSELGLGGLP